MVFARELVQARATPTASPVLFPSEVARFVSADALARDVAGMLGLDFCDIWGSVIRIPDNVLTLLDSPQGWTALGAFVAEDFGCELPGYAPTVH